RQSPPALLRSSALCVAASELAHNTAKSMPQQVEIKDVTPVVQYDSPTLGHVLERQRIEQLPINGRSYQGLLATVPGVDSTGIPQAYGMRTNTSVTLFDGTAVNETYEGWDFSRPPGLDSITEVKVEANKSSARFTGPMTLVH